jgi:hypothetical protein
MRNPVRTFKRLHAVIQNKHEVFVEWIERVNHALHEREGAHIVSIELNINPDMRRTAYIEYEQTEMR